MTNSPTLLLVHGAFGRATQWRRLIDELPGIDTLAVQLPSSAPAPIAQLGGLYDDALTIRSAVEAVDGPVIVCAHSYGGVATTQAVAALCQVRRLVFLNSFVLDVGESMLTNRGGSYPPHWVVHEAEGYIELRGAESMFFNDMTTEEASAASAALVTQSLASMTETITQAAWHSIPSVYVTGERDRGIPDAMREKFAARVGSVVRMGTSHAPFLSQPRATAAMLRREFELGT